MKLPAFALPSFAVSWPRVLAVFMKETVQMRRDRLTFAVMVAMPLIQLLLFGYAINTDPRHMPAAIEMREDGPLTRSFLASLRASSYVDIVAITHRSEQGEALLRSGDVNFVISIPEGFERRLVRGERPELLVSADATDPVAAGGVLSALEQIARTAFAPELQGPLAFLAPTPPPYDVVVHRLYNPAGVSALNIVPGLLGVILTMTMIMVTSIALTRETERGTMEMLLSTPVNPIEIMIGKTAPYVMVGAVQTLIVFAASTLLFHIPFTGSFLCFVAGVAIFILGNLLVGYLISTAARSQMQAMQLTFFVLLPSILLSGFMFPFKAMPGWAQAIGEAIPITHFLRITRETMLKEAGFEDVVNDLVPLILIVLVIATLSVLRFRRTLD